MRDWNELLGTIAWINRETTAVPCFHPYHDNDYLYAAYLIRLYRPTLTNDQIKFIKEEFYQYAFKFQRFRKTDSISHDEALGLAFIFWYLGDKEIAHLFIACLRSLGGMVPEQGRPWPDILRIPGVEMFLGISAGEKPSTLPQLLFLGSCIVSALSKKNHASPFLRKWLVVPLCSDAPIALIGVLFFSLVMWIRRFTLKDAFTQYFSKVKQIHDAAEGKGWLSP